jgi:hypothetical protein
MIDIIGAIRDIWARITRQACSLDFWSASVETFTIPAVAADTALPNVTVVLPAGAVLVRVIAMFKYRKVSAVAASALTGAQDIQVRTDAPGAWADCINLVDNQWTLAAADIEGGDVLIGNIDVKATVIGDDIYNFQLDEAVADSALVFTGVQVGLRVWYR